MFDFCYNATGKNIMINSICAIGLLIRDLAQLDFQTVRQRVPQLADRWEL
ncbi:hypothetical protein E2C01_066994 [Portunus trituberculatus]|uniref:Uncharacterized protein n=1 Tax=Portunus trituberculatus TaxID=210409 RepID=A0A5B7HMZ5_PORTR|nr:hypothetical protein [Portunus trituberculatus]